MTCSSMCSNVSLHTEGVVNSMSGKGPVVLNLEDDFEVLPNF